MQFMTSVHSSPYIFLQNKTWLPCYLKEGVKNLSNGFYKFKNRIPKIYSITAKSYLYAAFKDVSTYAFDFIKTGNMYWVMNRLFDGLIFNESIKNFLSKELGIPCFLMEVIKFGLHGAWICLTKSIIQSEFYTDLLKYLNLMNHSNGEEKINIKKLSDYFSVSQIKDWSWNGVCKGGIKVNAFLVQQFLVNTTQHRISKTVIKEFIDYTREHWSAIIQDPNWNKPKETLDFKSLKTQSFEAIIFIGTINDSSKQEIINNSKNIEDSIPIFFYKNAKEFNRSNNKNENEVLKYRRVFLTGHHTTCKESINSISDKFHELQYQSWCSYYVIDTLSLLISATISGLRNFTYKEFNEKYQHEQFNALNYFMKREFDVKMPESLEPICYTHHAFTPWDCNVSLKTPKSPFCHFRTGIKF